MSVSPRLFRFRRPHFRCPRPQDSPTAMHSSCQQAGVSVPVHEHRQAAEGASRSRGPDLSTFSNWREVTGLLGLIHRPPRRRCCPPPTVTAGPCAAGREQVRIHGRTVGRQRSHACEPRCLGCLTAGRVSPGRLARLTTVTAEGVTSNSPFRGTEQSCQCRVVRR